MENRNDFFFSLKFDALVLLGLPLFAFFLYGYATINDAGRLDPFFYSGYMHNFYELLYRFDITYYVARFGVIFPGIVFGKLFSDPVAGFYALRYLLVVGSEFAMYLLFRKHYGRSVAVAVCFLYVSSALIGLTTLTDYQDAFTVPYLIIGFSILLLDPIPAWFWRFSTGVFLGLAINSNIFALAVIGLFVGSYYLANFRDLKHKLVFDAALINAGILFTCIIGAVVFFMALEKWNFLEPTFRVSMTLLGDERHRWGPQDGNWLRTNLHVILPILLFIWMLILKKGPSGILGKTTLVFAATNILFFYGYQLIMGGFVLYHPNYFSALIPSIVLMLAKVIYGLFGDNAPERRCWGLALMCLMVCFLQVLASDGYRFPANILWGIWLFVGVSFLFLLLTPHSVAATFLGAVALALAWQVLVIPMFGKVLHNPDRLTNIGASEADLYRVAIKFVKSVPKLGRASDRIGFWYSDIDPSGPPAALSFINSVQSTYLWSFTRIQPDGATMQMPNLGDAEKKALVDKSLKYLIIIGYDQCEIVAAQSSLSNNRIAYEVVNSEMIESGGFRIYLKALRLLHAQEDAALPIEKGR
jgi:hypothetical protein